MLAVPQVGDTHRCSRSFGRCKSLRSPRHKEVHSLIDSELLLDLEEGEACQLSCSFQLAISSLLLPPTRISDQSCSIWTQLP
jgi:hypothetical protein